MSFIIGAAIVVSAAYLYTRSKHHALTTTNVSPSTTGVVGGAQVINSSATAKTSTGDPRQTFSSISPIPAGLASLFTGGNNLTAGTIGSTGLQHGPATVVPLLATVAVKPTALDGKPAQNGYWLASKIWTPQIFCGATSLQDAKNRVGLAVARYLAAKLQHPINYYETESFITGVAQIYPEYVTQIANNLFPTCRFKALNGAIASDHTQNDGVFDPTKQIGDDMLHFNCLGAPGVAEYGTEAIPGDPQDCRGESAVGPNSPYHTS